MDYKVIQQSIIEGNSVELHKYSDGSFQVYAPTLLQYTAIFDSDEELEARKHFKGICDDIHDSFNPPITQFTPAYWLIGFIVAVVVIMLLCAVKYLLLSS